jgi:triosephosphate isomerase
MTNKYMYFVANWKMFGEPKAINSLNRVIKFSKLSQSNKFKLIYCPPYTLLNLFSKKLKKTKIDIGAQNCHEDNNFGAFTGAINSQMLKSVGANYIILGHSENRSSGENDILINRKIKSSLNNNLKIIFCIGETLLQKKNKLTHKILKKQIINGLKGIKKFSNVILAYEPVWSIGSGLIPDTSDLELNISYIKKIVKKNFKVKKLKVLYGGSVNPKNVSELNKIDIIDGFLVGSASQDSKKFIDIVQKTFI